MFHGSLRTSTCLGRVSVTTILVIPDTQVRPGVPFDHIAWAAQLATDRSVTAVVHLGDHWDMPSLSAYRTLEERMDCQDDFMEDCRSGNEALALFDWDGPKHLLRGNHEYRIDRARASNPMMRKLLTDHQLRSPGWTVYPFLEIMELEGVLFSHYFCRNAQGRVTGSKNGAPNARLQTLRYGQSTVAGHKQGLDTARIPGVGRGIISGSFYQHEEAYLTLQGNHHWQGVLILHDVKRGEYDLEEVSLERLRRLYGPHG